MPGAVETSVLEFYNDATIFLTGGTGFVGKTLIEKLLRICQNIHIYVLIRVKKGKDPQTRLKELFEDPLFKRLRSEKPDFDKKVTCIPGDVSTVRLSISDSDYEFLTKEVTHVIHSAATVRFNEHLKSAIGINVLGTREIVALCKKCVRLKVLVHVSTAYSNCVNRHIREEFYEPPITADRAITLAETLSEDALNSLTPELIKPWPNTYTFTKAIAESIIKEKAKSLPCLVVRPAIVMGTLKEPVEGWIDNIYGPTGLIVGVGLGLLRVLYGDKGCEANLVPVDLTVNCILCSAWDVGTNFNNNTVAGNSLYGSADSGGLGKETETIPKVYNFVGDRNNLINWGYFIDRTLNIGMEMPSTKTIWYYSLTFTNIKLLYFFLIYLLHYIPALLADAVFLLLGKKPQLVKAYQKIHVFSKATGAFSSKSWTFADQNTKKLWHSLREKDREMFYFEMKSMNWDVYLRNVLIGIRRFILKEPEHDLPSARRKMFFLWLGHRLLQFSFTGLCLWLLNKLIFRFDIFQTHFKNAVLMQTGNST